MRHIRVKTANLVAGQSLLSKNQINKLEKLGLKFVGNHFLHIGDSPMEFHWKLDAACYTVVKNGENITWVWLRVLIEYSQGQIPILFIPWISYFWRDLSEFEPISSQNWEGESWMRASSQSITSSVAWVIIFDFVKMELSEKRCDKKNFIETSTGNRGKDFSEVQDFYAFWSFEVCHASLTRVHNLENIIEIERKEKP